MIEGVVINLPVAYVAAVLTGFEYILSTFTALAARASLRGAWLYHLHKRGKASINARSRARRGFFRDLFLTVLGLSLVVSVALVENGLISIVDLKKSPEKSSLCVRLDRPIDPILTNSIVPTMQTSIEIWVAIASQKLVCEGRRDGSKEESAITTVGVGGFTTIGGDKEDMYAPHCQSDGAVPAKSVNVRLTNLRIEPNRISLKPELTNSAEIFPFSSDGIIRNESNEAFNSFTEEVGGPCLSRNLSSLRTTIYTRWRARFAQSRRVMQAVHNSICQNHPSTAEYQRALTMVETMECAQESVSLLNASCLHQKAMKVSSELKIPLSTIIFQVSLSNLSFLSFGMARTDPSYACVNSKVLIDYLLVDPYAITSIRPTCRPKNRVVIPLQYQVQSGHCERTIHVLARSALMNSADSEWRSTELSALSRITRYRLFMMSLSSSIFPLKNVDVNPNDPDLECLVHEVTFFTLVRRNWTMALFCIIVGSSLIVMIVAIVCRCYFGASSWMVGSGNWSISLLLTEDLPNQGHCDHMGLEVAVQRQSGEFENFGRNPSRSSPEQVAQVVRNGRASEPSLNERECSTRVVVACAHEPIRRYGYVMSRVISRKERDTT